MANSRYFIAKKVTIINIIINTLLSLLKVIIGYFSHSQALLADGIHSFSDLISDSLVLFAAKAGGRLPDKEHPYGHQRIETIFTLLVALFIIGVGVAMGYQIWQQLFQRSLPALHDIPVIIAAIVSIFANEGLFRYSFRLGEKIHSNLIISNAYHKRSDAFISLIVLLSAIGATFGFQYLDALGGIIIAFLILKMGIKMFWIGSSELIDRGVDENLLIEIKNFIKQIPGVESIHQLRTRLHAGNIFVDLHIIVNSFISVSEGHHIGEQVHELLMDKFNQITDVVVHIDPENDETSKPCLHLPNRQQLKQQLQLCWHDLPHYQEIEKLYLHYLDGQLYIELFLSNNSSYLSHKMGEVGPLGPEGTKKKLTLADLAQLQKLYQDKASHHINHLAKVTLCLAID